MEDDALNALLEKSCETQDGQVRAIYVLSDLEKLAPIYADEATRPVAEAELAKWESGTDELRKAMAGAWLARAKSALSGAGKAVAAGYNHVEGKVEAAGAHAGTALAPHTKEGRDLARLAAGTRSNPRTPAGSEMRANVREAHSQAMAGAASDPKVAQAARMATRGGRGPQGSEFSHDSAMQPHREAAYHAARGAERSAIQGHSAQMARHGRTAARWGFRAGLIAGGAKAAAGAGRALSQKEHDERVAAGHHSHHGHPAQMVAKRAPIQLGKSWGG